MVPKIFYGPILRVVRLMGKGDLTNGDCMLPVKTDKDIIRYLR